MYYQDWHVTWSDVIANLKAQRNDGFKNSDSPMAEVNLPNFHTFYTNFLPSRPSNVQELSCHILDSFLLSIDSSSKVVGARGRQDGVGQVIGHPSL